MEFRAIVIPSIKSAFSFYLVFTRGRYTSAMLKWAIYRQKKRATESVSGGKCGDFEETLSSSLPI